MKKLCKCFKGEKRVKFILENEATWLSYFTNTKDKIPSLSLSSVVYKFVSPGYSSSYIRKIRAQFMVKDRKTCLQK